MSEYILSGPEFIKFAGSDAARWLGLKTATIQHKAFGAGVVSDVLMVPGQNTNVVILFGETPAKRFTPPGFQSGVLTSIVLPTALHPSYEEWIAVKRQEQAREAAINELQARLNKAGHGSLSARSLHGILDKMQSGADLRPWETSGLEEIQAYSMLAEHFHRRYVKGGIEWDLVKACAYLRMDGKPENALSLSSPRLMLVPADARPRAALYTVRGAALRDLERFDEARVALEKAIEVQPNSPYAYNALGALLQAIGMKREAFEVFGVAQTLGARSGSADADIKHLLSFDFVGQ